MKFLNALNRYRYLHPSILKLIAAQFCLQSINSAFFLLLNYYMTEEGYADYEIANVLSWRFLAVFWLAFPLGLFIKGRLLKPFFMTAALFVPIFSFSLLVAIDYHWDSLIYLFAMGWGSAFICMQITVLPFVLLNAKPENHSEAFSLSFLTFTGSICIIGVGHFLLNYLNPDFFNEKMTLQMVSAFGFLSVYFISKIDIKENLTEIVPFQKIWKSYDWGLILKVVVPTFIIAIGAGFTIPVINLFFLNVHQVESDVFALLGASTYFLVVCVTVFMPYIKRNFGYHTAITLFQSLAVLALFMMATTEYYSAWKYALPVAIFFYLIRQPLMNAVMPMTSELAMYYVGKRNQEIISALNASIWSGSWFVSMNIFGWLRQMEFRYVSIFLITVGMYVIGVLWYAYLIWDYKRGTTVKSVG